MSQSIQWISLLVIMATCNVWSFWGKDRPDSNWPISREAKVLEQSNNSEVLMQATGYAYKTKYLDDDIKRAAIWYLLYSGTDPLLQTEEERKAFERIAENFFKKTGQFVPWISPKVLSQRKHDSDSKWKEMSRVRELKINKRMLRQVLIQQGVIQDRAEILEEVGLPYIMVLPDAPEGQTAMEVFSNNDLANHTAGVIESFLTSRKYEIMIPKAQADIGQMIELSSQGATPDPAYQIAMSVGADVYIVFSGSVDRQGLTHKAAVSVKAYETTTGRGLGTETGYSKDRPLKIHEKALIEEATNDAIEKVLSRVDQYWKKDQEKGAQYRVHFKMASGWPPELKTDVQDRVAFYLEENFRNIREVALTPEAMEFIIWAPRSQAKKASSLYRKLKNELEASVPRLKVSRQVLNKKLLILELKSQ